LFEGLTHKSNRVYAYDLIITDYQGNTRCTRDAYSFLPTLARSTLPFGREQRRNLHKLGATGG